MHHVRAALGKSEGFRQQAVRAIDNFELPNAGAGHGACVLSESLGVRSPAVAFGMIKATCD